MEDTKNYAVVRDGGKQYIVSVGDTVFLERRAEEPTGSLELDDVLAVRNGGEFTAGPSVKAKVLAEIEKEILGPKTVSYMFKRRKGSHKKQGHRQKYLKVRITEITAG